MDSYEVTTDAQVEPQTSGGSQLPPAPKGHWKEVSVGISALGLILALGYVVFDSMYADNQVASAITPLSKAKPLVLADAALIAQAPVVYDHVRNPTAHAILSARGRDEIVVIKQDALTKEGDSNLHEGDVWRLADLLAFGLTTSSNDAMAAVASIVSEEGLVSRMNEEAKVNGLSQSYYLNETGLDVSSSTAGAYGSALDVVNLMKNYPDVFEATAYAPRSESGSGEGTLSTIEPIWDIPGLIGAKTGYTDLAGGNLAVAVDIGLGEPVIAVVLGSTRDGRFEDIRTLIEAARDSRVSQEFK